MRGSPDGGPTVNDERIAEQADEAAEQYVLGSMLMSAAIVDEVAEIATGEDFSVPRHQAVFDAIMAVTASGQPVDAKSVAYRLAETGELKRVGGDYLHTLLSAPPTALNGPFHARKVADLGTRRRLLAACVEGIQRAQTPTQTTDQVAEGVQAAIHRAVVTKESTTSTISETLDAEFDKIIDGSVIERGLSTRLGILDDLIGGLKPGQLVIVAGRPGTGKSVLCSDFARAAALREAEPAVFVSIEMGRDEVVKRVLAAESGVNLSNLMHGPLNAFDRDRAIQARDAIYGAPFLIKDEAGATLSSIRATARKVQAERGLGLIVVDYLQLMTTSGASDNRAAEVGEISRGLKIMARELGVPVVAAAQLNRSSENRTDRRPQLSDLRESGSIEQDADIVILLHRPDYQDAESERAGEIDLIVAKNRNGPIDTVTASAQLAYSRICDFTTP